MSAKVIHIPSKAWDLMKRAGILILICLIIGIIINLFSPTVTLLMDPNERLEFWIILCLVGGIGIFISDILLALFSPKWPELIKAFFQSIAGTIAVLIPLFTIYGPEDLPSYERAVIFVWAIMALIVAGAFIFSRQTRGIRQDQISDTVTPTSHNMEPKVLSRLPIHLQSAELYALSAEDHYVRIHTSKGEEMVLMRLSDAIAETEAVSGLQTHRSWWVSKEAIKDIQSKGRNAEITLKGDIKVPVSRNALKILKSKGWF